MGPFTFLPAALVTGAAIAFAGWFSIATCPPARQAVEVRFPRDGSCTPPSSFEAQDRARVVLSMQDDRLHRTVGGQAVASDMELVIELLEMKHESSVPVHVDAGVPWRDFMRSVERIEGHGFRVELYPTLRR